MSYLNDLFEKIASDLNRPINDFLPFIKILEDNWYDSQQSLKQIKDEHFDAMKIPKRIVAKIRDFTSTNHSSQKQTTQKKMQEIEEHNSNSKFSVINFDKALKEEVPYEDIFINFMASLQIETNNNKTKQLESLRLLIKIVQNIIQNPDDQKFKSIKLTSKTLTNNILCYNCCSYILEVIGFIKTSEDILMPQPDISHLKSCRRNLEIVLEKVERMHDPYQASFNSSSVMPNMISETSGQNQEKNYKQLLDQLVAYRKQKMSHPPSNRNVRIYHKRHQQKQVEMSTVTLEQQFQSQKDPVLRQYWKKFSQNNSQSSTFKNKRKIEFQLLIKQPIYQSTLIKIRLPGEYILQGMFGPYETVGNVIDFARSYCQGDVYIYTTPPVVRMQKNRNKSLMEMDCVPMGMFYLGAENTWQIKPQYVAFIEC